MSASTMEEYKRLTKEAQNSSKVVLFGTSLLLGKHGLLSGVLGLFVYHRSRKALADLDKLNKLCVARKCHGECGFEFKDTLVQSVNLLEQVIGLREEVGASKFITDRLRMVTAELEDRIEDYEIVSDPEIKELVSDLSAKLKKRHAVH